jgi:ATP-dependent Zn protease
MMTPTPKKRVTALERTAYHEAGHTLLAAAIGDRPHLVSIRRDGECRGFTMYKYAAARMVSAVQIHLAGPAAEEVLTGRRPKNLDGNVIRALLVRRAPGLAEIFAHEVGTDGCLAVRELLSEDPSKSDEEVAREVNRLYEVARRSLVAVWPFVTAVAKALLRHEVLDEKGIDDVIRGDIYTPVFQVQEVHGLMELGPPRPLIGPPDGDA